MKNTHVQMHQLRVENERWVNTACNLVQSTHGDELSHTIHEKEEENDFITCGASVVMSLLYCYCSHFSGMCACVN